MLSLLWYFTLNPLTRTQEDAEDQVLQDLRQFFDCILQEPQMKIVDLAGGPGCCAAGAWRFFTGSMGCRTVEATVADPVEECLGTRLTRLM